MKKKIFLLCLCGFFSLHFYSQNIITWELLKNVEFDEIWSEEFQAYYMVPKFSSSVKAMDNKEVQIRGFIIPVDIVQDYYVLSANPYSSCFFCGQAGPESVMEVQMVKSVIRIRSQLLPMQILKESSEANHRQQAFR